MYAIRSYYVRITKCKNKTAEETKRAINGSLGGEIETFVNSITFDRGTEGAEHEKISEYLNADIYFCHPYCSWEKGSVENRNMFIRRYFPRHTDMSQITDDIIYEVQEKLNDRPMKCLKYRTPNVITSYSIHYTKLYEINTEPSSIGILCCLRCS